MALVEEYAKLNSDMTTFQFDLYNESVDIWNLVKKRYKENINSCLYLTFNKKTLRFQLEDDEEHFITQTVFGDENNDIEIVIYPSTFQKYYTHQKTLKSVNDGFTLYLISRFLEYCVISLLLSKQKQYKSFYILNRNRGGYVT